MATPLIMDPRFLTFLGSFYANWTSADMTIDFAVGRFLNLPHETTQILTAGMQYGAKIRVLREIIRKSDDPNKPALIRALNKMQNESKRNAFAHSYLIGENGTVSFIERSAGGDYEIKEHSFNYEEWTAHVLAFSEAARDFWVALGSPDEALRAFGLTAANAAKKSKRSASVSKGPAPR